MTALNFKYTLRETFTEKLPIVLHLSHVLVLIMAI